MPVGSQPGIPAGIPGPVKGISEIPVPVGSQPGIPAGIPVTAGIPALHKKLAIAKLAKAKLAKAKLANAKLAKAKLARAKLAKAKLAKAKVAIATCPQNNKACKTLFGGSAPVS